MRIMKIKSDFVLELRTRNKVWPPKDGAHYSSKNLANLGRRFVCALVHEEVVGKSKTQKPDANGYNSFEEG